MAGLRKKVTSSPGMDRYVCPVSKRKRPITSGTAFNEKEEERMKSLSKLMKIVVVMLVSVLAVAFLSGCGSSPDKFAGHWIGYGTTGYRNVDCIYDITIEKNGNGYLVNYSKAYWGLDPTSKTPGFTFGRPNYKYEWTQDKQDNLSATAKDDTLAIQGEGMPFFTYIEKDKTLQFAFRNDERMGVQERIALHPAEENEVQDFKDKAKTKLQQKIDPNTADISFTDQ